MTSIPPYNNTITNCNSDLDCPGNSQCVYQSLKENKSIGVCGCAPEWGNGGPLCDEYGATTYYKLSIYSIYISIFIIILFVVVLDLHRLHQQKRLKSLDIKVTTLFECACGSICAILFHISGVLSVSNPDAINLQFDKVHGYLKYSSFNNFRYAVTATMGFFYVAAIMNLGALWLEIAIVSKRFKKLTNPQISRKYIFGVVAVDIILVIAIIITSQISISYTGLAVAPVTVIIVFGYGYSAFSINSVIREQVSRSAENRDSAKNSPGDRLSKNFGEDKDAKMKESLRRIQICAIILVIAQVLNIAGILLNSITGNMMRRIYIPPSTVYYPTFLLDIAFIGQIIGYYMVYWYIHSFIKKDARVEDLKRTASKITISKLVSSKSDGEVIPTASS